MSHFIPTTTNVTAPQTAKLVFDNIIRLHGLPSVIISDRDTRFTSNFWKSEWEVERILKKRKIGKGCQYLVTWKDFPAYEATWEPARNLKGSAEELIREFDQSQQ